MDLSAGANTEESGLAARRAAARSGEQAVVAPVVGFDEFYSSEYLGLVRLAVGFVDDPRRAEELVQDAFERTLLHWQRVRTPGGFVRQVLVNAARSELRRRAVSRRKPLEPPSDVEPPERDDSLLAALRTLTPRRRMAVVLRFLDDQSEATTADLMGCRVGTVKSLVSRGLADLKEALEP